MQSFMYTLALYSYILAYRSIFCNIYMVESVAEEVRSDWGFYCNVRLSFFFSSNLWHFFWIQEIWSNVHDLFVIFLLFLVLLKCQWITWRLVWHVPQLKCVCSKETCNRSVLLEKYNKKDYTRRAISFREHLGGLNTLNILGDSVEKRVSCKRKMVNLHILIHHWFILNNRLGQCPNKIKLKLKLLYFFNI